MIKLALIFLIIITISCASKIVQNPILNIEDKKECNKITINQQIGIADTIMSFLSGEIIECGTEKPIQYCKVVLTSIKTRKVFGGITDVEGKYSLSAPADNYYLSFNQINYRTMRDTLKLHSGEMRKINSILSHK